MFPYGIGKNLIGKKKEKKKFAKGKVASVR